MAINNAESMASREKARIKAYIVQQARKDVASIHSGGVRATIMFCPDEASDTFFCGYSSLERNRIVSELTLEIIDEFIESLKTTRRKLTLERKPCPTN